MNFFCLAWRLHKKEKPQSLLFNLKNIITKAAPLLMLSTLLVIEPSFAAQTSQPPPQYGGTLRLGWYRQPAPFDPFNVTDTITSPMMELIFNRLVKVNVQGDLEPDLAERWEISADGLVYTFHLNPDVRFHDGHACTSDDVLHSFNLYRDVTISHRFNRYFDNVQEWSAPTPSTFEIKLKQPFAPFLRYIAFCYIAPKHKLENPSIDLNSFKENPIGTGPFIYAGQESEKILFKGNEDYFEGRPWLNEVVVKIFPSKSLTWSAFLRGEIDVVFQLEQAQSEQVFQHPDIRIFSALSAGGYSLMFNLKDPIFSNPKIREAVSLAIDKKEIIEKVEQDHGIPITGPFHPNSWAYDQTISTAYDPLKARILLDELGYTDRKLSFDILVDKENEHLVTISKIIRQQLQEVGIEIRQHFLSDFSDSIRKIEQDKLKFQTYLFPNTTGTDPNTVSRYWETGEIFNYGKYSNPEVDALFKMGRKIHDFKSREKIYKDIHRLVSKDQPAIFLYAPYLFYGYSKDIFNVESFLGFIISFHYIKQVYKLNIDFEKGGEASGNGNN